MIKPAHPFAERFRTIDLVSPYPSPANQMAAAFAPEPPPPPTWWDSMKLRLRFWWSRFRTPKPGIPLELQLLMVTVQCQLQAVEDELSLLRLDIDALKKRQDLKVKDTLP